MKIPYYTKCSIVYFMIIEELNDDSVTMTHFTLIGKKL